MILYVAGAEGEEEEDDEDDDPVDEDDDPVDEDDDPVDEGSDVEAGGVVGVELGDEPEPPPHAAQISVLAATTRAHRMARASSRFSTSSSRLRACEPACRRW